MRRSGVGPIHKIGSPEVAGNMLSEWYNTVFGQALLLPLPYFALAICQIRPCGRTLASGTAEPGLLEALERRW